MSDNSKRRLWRPRLLAGFALATLWGGWMLWEVYGYLAAQDRAHFLEKARWTTRHYARLLSDAATAGEPLLAQAYVRQLAGELDARYAAWVDREGRLLASGGSLPESPWADKLMRQTLDSDDFLATEVTASSTGGPGFIECAEPVWARGEKQGALRWGLWTDDLALRRRDHAKRLLATGAWGLGAGLVLAAWCYFRHG